MKQLLAFVERVFSAPDLLVQRERELRECRRDLASRPSLVPTPSSNMRFGLCAALATAALVALAALAAWRSFGRRLQRLETELREKNMLLDGPDGLLQRLETDNEWLRSELREKNMLLDGPDGLVQKSIEWAMLPEILLPLPPRVD